MPTLSAKVLKILEFLKHFRLKYLVSLVVTLVMAHVVFGFASPRPILESVAEEVAQRDSLRPIADTTARDSLFNKPRPTSRRNRRARRGGSCFNHTFT